MTEEHRRELIELESLARVLATQFAETKRELADTKESLSTLQDRFERQSAELSELRRENASLKLAKTVSYSRDEAIAERERLISLVKKIDNCITLLK